MPQSTAPPAEGPPGYRTIVGEGLPDLNARLSNELDEFNAAATVGVAPARELTVQVLDDADDLAGGMSGWTWGIAAGIAMAWAWVREDARRCGLGGTLLAHFEAEARARSCRHVFVTSFTFQAPAFYEHHGYREIFRWDGLPTPEAADVHFRKDL